LEAAEEAIRLKGDYHLAWINKSGAPGAHERYDEALFTINKAINLRNSEPLAWSHRSWVLNCLSRYEEALASSERAIDIKEDESTAWIEIPSGDQRGDCAYDISLDSFLRAVPSGFNIRVRSP